MSQVGQTCTKWKCWQLDVYSSESDGNYRRVPVKNLTRESTEHAKLSSKRQVHLPKLSRDIFEPVHIIS